jgi:hypothetical protein
MPNRRKTHDKIHIPDIPIDHTGRHPGQLGGFSAGLTGGPRDPETDASTTATIVLFFITHGYYLHSYFDTLVNVDEPDLAGRLFVLVGISGTGVVSASAASLLSKEATCLPYQSANGAALMPCAITLKNTVIMAMVKMVSSPATCSASRTVRTYSIDAMDISWSTRGSFNDT